MGSKSSPDLAELMAEIVALRHEVSQLRAHGESSPPGEEQGNGSAAVENPPVAEAPQAPEQPPVAEVPAPEQPLVAESAPAAEQPPENGAEHRSKPPQEKKPAQEEKPEPQPPKSKRSEPPKRTREKNGQRPDRTAQPREAVRDEKQPAKPSKADEPPAERRDAPDTASEDKAKPKSPAADKSADKPTTTSYAKNKRGRKQPAASDPRGKQEGPGGDEAEPANSGEEPAPNSSVWRFQMFGAWSTSVIVHMVIIIIMGLWMLPAILTREPPELTALQERPQEELNQFLTEDLRPTDEVTLTSSNSAVREGHATSLTGVSDPSFDAAVEKTDGPTVNVGDLSIDAVPGNPFSVDLSDEAPGDPHAIVDGYEHAMDRITHEILMMLQKSKVMVVWVFDQSVSMKDDQEEIRVRISKVYKELGLHGATAGDALLTGVVSYGSGFKVHTERAIANVTQIENAIAAVPEDPSGQEQMCLAVGHTINHFRNAALAGRRQMAMILVTDESGDQKTNRSVLEAAIAEARSARCRIYVLGREAVFGYPYAHMFWRHPQTGHLHKLPVDRGPESPQVEQLQTNGFSRRYDAHPAGFGPYEQCRMARETGGIFFMLPSIESDLVREDGNALLRFQTGKINKEEYLKESAERRRFTLQRLRPYMPSLETRREYELERDQSVLRRSLWTVIRTLNPYDPDLAKVIEMRMRFSGRPAPFGNQVAEELVKAKLYFNFLNKAEKALEGLTDERQKEIYPRWQANYDLLRAQVIAYRVRLHEYGAYLETFIKALGPNPTEEVLKAVGKDPKQLILRQPHPNGKPNHFLVLSSWDIVHRPETLTGELTSGDIERSKQLFREVIEKHYGTPWAERAEWELKRGFGVGLEAKYHHQGPPGPARPRPKPIPIPIL